MLFDGFSVEFSVLQNQSSGLGGISIQNGSNPILLCQNIALLQNRELESLLNYHCIVDRSKFEFSVLCVDLVFRDFRQLLSFFDSVSHFFWQWNHAIKSGSIHKLYQISSKLFWTPLCHLFDSVNPSNTV